MLFVENTRGWWSNDFRYFHTVLRIQPLQPRCWPDLPSTGERRLFVFIAENSDESLSGEWYTDYRRKCLHPVHTRTDAALSGSTEVPEQLSSFCCTGESGRIFSASAKPDILSAKFGRNRRNHPQAAAGIHHPRFSYGSNAECTDLPASGHGSPWTWKRAAT